MQPAAVPRRRRIPPKFPDESISNPELFFPANKNIKMPAGAMLSLKLNITGWCVPLLEPVQAHPCSRALLFKKPESDRGGFTHGYMFEKFHVFTLLFMP